MSPRARTRSPSPEQRLELMAGDAGGRRAEFGRHVARGLDQAPRRLPGRWALDGAGVELLRRLWKAPTSYVLRAERQLLADRAYALPLYFPHEAPRVIETGVVDSARTGAVLGPLLEDFGTIAYTAVGPDRAAVEGPCRELVGAHPGLEATAMVGRIEDAVRDLRASAGPVLLFWSHTGLSDVSRTDGLTLLRGLGAALRRRDLLVATVDLRKDPRLVQRVYRDRHGVAKQLHLHLLERMNDELGAHFDVSAFRHRFTYDEPAGEMESHLVSRRAQTVRIDALDLDVEFGKGEALHTETLTRYSPQEIDHAAQASELIVHERWYDRDGQVCANLMRPGG